MLVSRTYFRWFGGGFGYMWVFLELREVFCKGFFCFFFSWGFHYLSLVMTGMGGMGHPDRQSMDPSL